MDGKKAREKNLERRFKKAVESDGSVCLKLGMVYMIGMPDRLVIGKGGWVIFAEIKSEGEKPRPTQARMHEKLRKLGFEVLIIDSEDSLQKAIMYVEQRRVDSRKVW